MEDWPANKAFEGISDPPKLESPRSVVGRSPLLAIAQEINLFGLCLRTIQARARQLWLDSTFSNSLCKRAARIPIVTPGAGESIAGRTFLRSSSSISLSFGPCYWRASHICCDCFRKSRSVNQNRQPSKTAWLAMKISCRNWPTCPLRQEQRRTRSTQN